MSFESSPGGRGLSMIGLVKTSGGGDTASLPCITTSPSGSFCSEASVAIVGASSGSIEDESSFSGVMLETDSDSSIRAFSLWHRISRRLVSDR